MNHIYKTVWNATLGTWTAVQETAKSHGKTSSGKAARIASQGSLVLRFAFTLVASAALLVSGRAIADAFGNQHPVPAGNGNHYCYYDATSQSVICGDDATKTVNPISGKTAKAIVIGKGALNTGESSMAIGLDSSSAGTASLAVGNSAKAGADQAVAVGQHAQANGKWDVSIGRQAGWNAKAPNSAAPTGNEGRNIAIGDAALKNGLNVNNNMAMGTSAGENLTGTHNVIIGTYANADEAIQSAMAAGSNQTQINFKEREVDVLGSTSKRKVKYIDTSSTVAIGHRALATSAGGVAVGQQAKAFGATTVAIGNSSRALGNNAVAMGNTANAGATAAIAIGHQVNYQPEVKNGPTVVTPAAYKQAGANSIAIGTHSHSSALRSIAIGTEAKATGEHSTALGNEAAAKHVWGVAIGHQAETRGKYALAIGAKAKAGSLSVADGNSWGMAIGYNAEAGGWGSPIAIGTESKTLGESPVAIGDFATAEGNGAVAIGGKRSGKHLPRRSTYAKGVQTTALGYLAQATEQDALALGANANALHQSSVALGSGSFTTDVDNNGRNSATVGGITYSGFAADAPTSMVSVGRVQTTIPDPENPSAPNIVLLPISRTITNVAAGRIAADSTDAINGSQLHATQTVIGNVAGSVKDILGGDAAVGGDGKLSMSNIGGTGKGTIHEAIAAATTKVTSNNSSIGVTHDATTNTYDLSVNAQGLAESAQLPVVYTKANGDKVYKHSDGNFYDKPEGDPAAQQLDPANIIASMQNAAGSTTAPTTLANVKAGVKPTDAVNVSQLQGAATALGGGAGVNTDGTFKAPSYTISKTDGTSYAAVDNVGAALGNLNAEVVKPLSFAGDSGSNIDRKLGSTLNVKGGATGALSDGNIGVVADATTNTLNIKLAQNIDLGAAGSVQTGNTTVNNDGITIAATSPVSLTAQGLNNGGNQVINVASGGDVGTNAANIDDVKRLAKLADTSASVSAGSTAVTVTPSAPVNGVTSYAVDLSDATKASLAKANNSVQDIKSIDPNLLVSKNGKNITLDFKDDPKFGKTTVGNVVTDGATNKITGLNNGVLNSASKDAVNGSQLYAVGNSTAAALGGTSAFDPATGAVTAGLNVGGTTHTSVQDALNAINTTAGAGWNLQANGGAASNVAPNGTVNVIDGKNTTVTLTGNTLKVDVVDAPTFTGKVTAGGGLDVAGSGLTVGGSLTVAPNTNVDMGNNIIHNVADGVADTDAANMGQLRAMSGNITNITNQINAVDARVTNVDNRVTHLSGRVDGIDARVTNVDNRVTQVDSRVTDLTGRVDGIDTRVTDVTNLVGPNLTNPDGTKGLEVYDVSKQTLTEHQTVIEAFNQVKREGTKYSHTRDNGEAPIIGPSNASSAGALASTATGVNAIVDKEAESGFAAGHRARVLRRGKKGIAVGHNAVAGGESAVAVGDGAEAHGDQSLSFGTKNRVYADRSGAIGDPTTIIATATDSYSIGNNNTVNTADTFVMGNNVVTSVANSVYLGAGAAATAAPTAQTAGMASYNAQVVDGVTHHYAGGTPVGVVSVGDVGQERRVQNVAAGLVSPTSTDAINGSQLYQTNAAIGNLNNRINVNHDKAMGGIASAMASAGLPQAYLPGKSMIAMGVGAYQGRSAVAVGVSTISDNGRWIIKGSVNANNKGNVGATLGAGYQW